MKAVIFSLGVTAALFAACNNDEYSKGDRAVDNARTYLMTELGDGVNYEEGKWGKVEPRKVEWKNSNRYKTYQDTLVMMQDHLKMMNDSLDAEMKVNGAGTPYYQSLQMRRDGYQMQLNTYQSNEFEMNKTYDNQPEYHGYWIYHEYNVDGQPRKAYIGFDDTTSYNATEVIYE
jgi:hypothetical protein